MQMLTQQALQMRHALRGLGRAYEQAFPGGQRLPIDSPQVMVPAQLQRQHRVVAGLQPKLQRTQQGLGRMQHRIGVVGGVAQIMAQHELLGQLQPVQGLGLQAVSLIQRPQSPGPDAPRKPGTRQGAHLPPSLAAQSHQHGTVGLQRGQRPQRQRIRRHGLRLWHALCPAVLQQPEPRQRQPCGIRLCAHRWCCRAGHAGHVQSLIQPLQHGLQPTPEALHHAGFHEQSLFQHGHAWRKLQRPPVKAVMAG